MEKNKASDSQWAKNGRPKTQMGWQSMGEKGEALSQWHWPMTVAGSGEQRCGEVGPWVGEMAGEVGDPIWSPVKEETHQRGFTMATHMRGVGGGDHQWQAEGVVEGASSEVVERW
jgi:hypothetical protein